MAVSVCVMVCQFQLSLQFVFQLTVRFYPDTSVLLLEIYSVYLN